MDLDDRRYPETPADFGYNLSALKLWNFTASAPASAAASIRRSAMSKSPLWLLPASAVRRAGAARIRDAPCRIPFAGLRHLVIGHRDDDGGGPRGGQFVGRLAAGGYRPIRRDHEIPHGPRGAVKHHVVGSSHPASPLPGAAD